MRIQFIEITNYKVFCGTHMIDVGGKNLFIYGENGNGVCAQLSKDGMKLPVVFDNIDLISKAERHLQLGKRNRLVKPNDHGCAFPDVQEKYQSAPQKSL